MPVGQPRPARRGSDGVLGRRSLRDYIRRDFFKAHLGRYSKSRRKAPIYWPLYVPSGRGAFGSTRRRLPGRGLFAIARAAANRLDAAEAEIPSLRREREAGGAGRSARQVAAALESRSGSPRSCERFRDEAERIAGLGWEPDLDDGNILAPPRWLASFPAWRDAAVARDEIRTGKYPWATRVRLGGRAVSRLREHLTDELAAKVQAHGVVIGTTLRRSTERSAAPLVPEGVRFEAFGGSWYELRRRIEDALGGEQPPR